MNHDPQLGDGELVLALEGATLCNSDLHTLTGRSIVILVIFVLGTSLSWSLVIFVYKFHSDFVILEKRNKENLGLI